MNLHEEQALELLRAAERDALTLSILCAEAAAPIETTLFHAQQAVEKATKAVLVSEGILFPRTHDLLLLCDLAIAHSLFIPVARDLLARLGPYAVEFRYIGVVGPHVGRDEAEQAVEAVLRWAREIVS